MQFYFNNQLILAYRFQVHKGTELVSSGHLTLRQTPTPLLTAVPVNNDTWAAEVAAAEARAQARAAAKSAAAHTKKPAPQQQPAPAAAGAGGEVPDETEEEKLARYAAIAAEKEKVMQPAWLHHLLFASRRCVDAPLTNNVNNGELYHGPHAPRRCFLIRPAIARVGHITVHHMI